MNLYIHENNKTRLKDVVRFWENVTGMKGIFSDRVYFKHHKPKSNRRNVKDDYYGSVRVDVKRSTDLNRKIGAWTKYICENCRLV